MKFILNRTHNDKGLKEYNVLARMLQISFVSYFVGGAFLSLTYFDLPWHLISFVVLLDSFMNTKEEAFNKNLLDILLVMIEHDDINLLVEVNKSFVTLVKKKLNIAYVEVTSPFTMDNSDQDNLAKELSDITNKQIVNQFKYQYSYTNKLIKKSLEYIKRVKI